jgi:hypothetical protein
MPTTNTKIVNDFNDRAAGGVVREFYRTGRDTTLAIDAFTFDRFDNWS